MTHRITVGEELRTADGLAAMQRKNVTLAEVSGTVATSTGAFRWYNDLGSDLKVVSTRASVGTAPVGSSLIVDIKLAGTSIYATTTANRPTILAAANTGQGGTPDTVTIPAGSYVTVDVLQIGSGTAGSNLRVAMVVSPVSN